MANRYWVGGTGTWDAASTANWSATSGGASGASAPTTADAVNFDSGSGTGTVTTAAGATGLTVLVNSTNINLTLGANLTVAGAVTLTIGTINLSSFTFTAPNFSSSNTNARTIAFGTGKFSLTLNNGFIWACNDTTNLTITGEPVVDLTYAGSTGTRTVIHGSAAGGTEALAVSINVTAGSDIIALDRSGTASVSYIKNLNFTGFTGTGPNTFGFAIYGNLILGAGMTVGNVGFTFSKSTGTQEITTNNVVSNVDYLFNGNATYKLIDNLTINAAKTATLTSGTLDLNNQTLSTGLFSSTNSNVRSIAFGTGNITITGSGTVWTTATPTNFSYTGTPTVNISNNSATATTVSTGALTASQALNFNYTIGTYTLTDTNSVYKNLNFTGFTGTVPNSVRTLYGNATYVAGATYTAGANVTTFAATSGTQQITTNAQTLDFPLTFNGIGGTFAFQDALTQGSTRAFTLTNGTVQLKNGVTSTVGNFVTTGTTQKNLQSTLAGTQATLSQASGTVTATNLTIKDSNAIGGATWNAYTDQSNIDAGNVDGWNFGISPVVGGAEYTYTIRSFTQPRRF
jgi:hypothetical protein